MLSGIPDRYGSIINVKIDRRRSLSLNNQSIVTGPLQLGGESASSVGLSIGPGERRLGGHLKTYSARNRCADKKASEEEERIIWTERINSWGHKRKHQRRAEPTPPEVEEGPLGRERFLGELPSREIYSQQLTSVGVQHLVHD
jgi:hypothetical protein